MGERRYFSKAVRMDQPRLPQRGRRRKYATPAEAKAVHQEQCRAWHRRHYHSKVAGRRLLMRSTNVVPKFVPRNVHVPGSIALNVVGVLRLR